MNAETPPPTPYANECPACGALVGRPCRRPDTGALTFAIHEERFRWSP